MDVVRYLLDEIGVFFSRGVGCKIFPAFVPHHISTRCSVLPYMVLPAVEIGVFFFAGLWA